MTLMEGHGLTLRERVRFTKAIALGNPTTEHIAAYGRAIMNHWANMSSGATMPFWRHDPTTAHDYQRQRSAPGQSNP